MVQELYLKYKDKYFQDFFTPEVRDLSKDKKELLLNELESMRKSTAILKNRRKYAEKEDWEEEIWECDRALKNVMQRGVLAAHLVLDASNTAALSSQEVLAILDTSCVLAKGQQSDLYLAVKRRWPWDSDYTVSESGKVFYEQCMRDYCEPQKRERFLRIVRAPKPQKTLASVRQARER